MKLVMTQRELDRKLEERRIYGVNALAIEEAYGDCMQGQYVLRVSLDNGDECIPIEIESPVTLTSRKT